MTDTAELRAAEARKGSMNITLLIATVASWQDAGFEISDLPDDEALVAFEKAPPQVLIYYMLMRAMMNAPKPCKHTGSNSANLRIPYKSHKGYTVGTGIAKDDFDFLTHRVFCETPDGSKSVDCDDWPGVSDLGPAFSACPGDPCRVCAEAFHMWELLARFDELERAEFVRLVTSLMPKTTTDQDDWDRAKVMSHRAAFAKYGLLPEAELSAFLNLYSQGTRVIDLT